MLVDFPFSKFSRVLDIGSANGSIIAGVLATYPHLSGVLFDQPQVHGLCLAICIDLPTGMSTASVTACRWSSAPARYGRRSLNGQPSQNGLALLVGTFSSQVNALSLLQSAGLPLDMHLTFCRVDLQRPFQWRETATCTGCAPLSTIVCP